MMQELTEKRSEVEEKAREVQQKQKEVADKEQVPLVLAQPVALTHARNKS